MFSTASEIVEVRFPIPTAIFSNNTWLNPRVFPFKGLTCVPQVPGWAKRYRSGVCGSLTLNLQTGSEGLFLGSDLLTLTLHAVQCERRPVAFVCKMIPQCDLKPLTQAVLYLKATCLSLALPQIQDMWPPGWRQMGKSPALFSYTG